MRTVLLVDDVAVVRHLLRVVLESTGEFRVVGEAGDGESAIAAAGQLRPDIVLLDLSMPGMDGLEALPLIRAAAPGAMVVVNSGFSSERAARSAMDAGAIAYLEKGLEPSAMVDRLLAVVGGSPGTIVDADGGERLDRVVASMAGLMVGNESTWWDPLLERLSDGVMVLDAEGRIQAWNRAAREMLELNGGAGVAWSDLGWELADANGERVDVRAWIDALSTANDNTGDASLRRAGAELQVWGVAVGRSEGARDGVVATVQRADAVGGAGEAEGSVSVVASLVGDAVVLVDAQDVVRSWNAPAEAMFGWNGGEILGRPLNALAAPGYAGDVDAVLAIARAGRTTQPRLIGAMTRDGVGIAVTIVVAPTSPDGRSVTVVFKDVAMQTRLEARAVRAEHEVVALRSAMTVAHAKRPTHDALIAALAALAVAADADFVQWWSADVARSALRATHATWSALTAYDGFRESSVQSDILSTGELVMRAWNSCEPHTERIASDGGAPRWNAAAAAGATSVLCVPVYVGGRVSGVLEFVARTDIVRDERACEFATTVAAVLANQLAAIGPITKKRAGVLRVI